ncbi:hypothetical protein [Cellulomonas sp. ATA003]|uniref:hypothetical protein n=1 Tax=Cellulomonas sp. ATA003 TaxID=3073064 RepID=UPI0028732B45|nr:hypothetical protein [Cellulomonas sp. ATA003]WNB84632.1 hypothetical protein REH70_12555 [Cellulomonas sp. ATA003]
MGAFTAVAAVGLSIESMLDRRLKAAFAVDPTLFNRQPKARLVRTEQSDPTSAGTGTGIDVRIARVHLAGRPPPPARDAASDDGASRARRGSAGRAAVSSSSSSAGTSWWATRTERTRRRSSASHHPACCWS